MQDLAVPGLPDKGSEPSVASWGSLCPVRLCDSVVVSFFFFGQNPPLLQELLQTKHAAQAMPTAVQGQAAIPVNVAMHCAGTCVQCSAAKHNQAFHRGWRGLRARSQQAP